VPSGRQHRKLTRDFLGWDLPEVHAVMDAAASFLGGRHRVVGHDLTMLAIVEERFGRPGRIVFALHLLQDAGHFRGGSAVGARGGAVRRPGRAAVEGSRAKRVTLDGDGPGVGQGHPGIDGDRLDGDLQLELLDGDGSPSPSR